MNRTARKNQPPVTPSSIQDYLDRMVSDTEEINKRLLEAPASLTGGKEPRLYIIMREIKSKLVSAQKIWL